MNAATGQPIIIPIDYTDDEDGDKTLISNFLADPASGESPPPYSPVDLIAGLFPPYWNLYHYKSHLKSTDYHIGTHRDQPLFTVIFGGTWKLKTGLTLTRYAGSELLAEIKSEKVLTTQSVASVPSANFECQLACDWNFKTTRYSFMVPVLDDRSKSCLEKFEWRSTHGKEARQIDKSGWGWKLVRVGQETTEDYSKAKRGDRPIGQTSDGKEIVAIWAENSSLSYKKYGKFRFLGIGATGQLGKTWAIMAVASICRIFQLEEGGE